MVTILRLGLLAALWVFVLVIVGVMRGDLYGTRVAPRPAARQARPVARANHGGAQTAPASDSGRRPRIFNRQQGPTTLVVTAGSLAGTRLPLREAGTLIGRSPECALVLDDDFVSGRHARIFHDGSQWMVEDLGSTNGTFLGQQRLTQPEPVPPGAVVRIGKTVVELQR